MRAAMTGIRTVVVAWAVALAASALAASALAAVPAGARTGGADHGYTDAALRRDLAAVRAVEAAGR